MVVGFNHNFKYKDHLFHVQTEDGGVKNPQIVTLLFSGGTILASRKTSYTDILKVNNLEQVVEELMKEQHREMLRRLKDGQFDPQIRERLGAAVLKTEAAREDAAAPKVAVQKTSESRPPSPAEKGPAEPDTALDDIILSYLMGETGGKS